jgi:uncharacterized membrane protein YoaK (UPF0700 family)
LRPEDHERFYPRRCGRFVVGLIQWAEHKTQALSIWDIGVLKIYCVLFGIIVGAYASSFVLEYIAWFVLAVIGFGVALGLRWLSVKPLKS